MLLRNPTSPETQGLPAWHGVHSSAETTHAWPMQMQMQMQCHGMSLYTVVQWSCRIDHLVL